MPKREYTTLDDVIARQSFSVGENPSVTIPEDQFPTSIAFRADERIDWIDRVDCKVENTSPQPVDNDVSVKLYFGTGSDGSLLTEETKTLSVDSNTTILSSFIEEQTQVVDGPYFVSVEPEAPLQIVRSDIHTLGSVIKREKQANGDEVWYDEAGRERARLHADSQKFEIPQLQTGEQRISDTSSEPANPGAFTNDSGDVKVHTGGSVKSLSDIGTGSGGSGSSSLDGLNDYYEGTLSSRPSAGTEGRIYITTDNNGIFYDDGTDWQMVADHPSNIGQEDLAFDPASQQELSNVEDSLNSSLTSHENADNPHNLDHADTGAIQDASDSVSTDHLQQDSVDTNEIAGNSVGTEELQDGSVGSQQIKEGTLGSSQIDFDQRKPVESLVFKDSGSIKAIDSNGVEIDSGSSSDASAISRVVQSAVVSAGDGTCHLSGDYRDVTLSTQIKFSSDVSIEGSAKFTWQTSIEGIAGTGEQALFYAEGEKGSRQTIPSDVDTGQRMIEVEDASPFEVSELVELENDRTIGGTGHNVEQIYKVQSVDATNSQVRLSEPVDTEYLTSDNAEITPVTHSPSPSIEGIEVHGVDPTDDSIGIAFELCDRPVARDVLTDSTGERGFYIIKCFDARITDVTGRHHLKGRDGGDGLGYGVSSNGSSHTRVIGSTFEDCRHCTAQTVSQGWDREMRLIGLTTTGGFNHVIDAHEARSLRVEDTTVVTSGDYDAGIVSGAKDTTIDGVIITGRHEDINTFGIDIRGDNTERTLNVSNVTMQNINGIRLFGEADFDSIQVENVHCKNTDLFLHNDSGSTVRNIKVTGSSMGESNANEDVGLKLYGVQSGSIDVNLTNVKGSAMQLIQCSNLKITGNLENINNDNNSGQKWDHGVELIDSNSCLVHDLMVHSLQNGLAAVVAEFGTSDNNTVRKIKVNSEVDAHTNLNGANSVYDSGEAKSSSVIQVVPTTARNHVGSSYESVTWDTSEIHDSDVFSFSGSSNSITVEKEGRYEVTASISYDQNQTIREAPGASLFVNGNQQNVEGLTGYIRNDGGHANSSVHISGYLLDLSPGDVVEIRTRTFSNSGGNSLRPSGSFFNIKSI